MSYNKTVSPFALRLNSKDAFSREGEVWFVVKGVFSEGLEGLEGFVGS